MRSPDPNAADRFEPDECRRWFGHEVVVSNDLDPAIVEQFDSTIVVPAGWKAQVDGYANLILSRER